MLVLSQATVAADGSMPGVAPASADNAPAGIESVAARNRLEAVEFDQIPGWRDDNLLASLRGLRQSCIALANRPEWAAPCADIARLGADTEQARQFYQQHFQAYRMLAPSTQPDVIAGYFEPELQGSRERSGSYQFPVYGPPRDLLRLDGRILTGADRQQFVIEDGQLRLPRTDDGSAREYRLDLAGLRVDGRDGAYRVRVEGDRILPYYSRQEIATRLLDAPVLAWVEDPLALQSLQQQAGGRIRLAGGEALGLQWAADNGLPLPPRTGTFGSIASASQPLTRGSRAGAGRPAKSLSDEELFQLIASVDAQAEIAAKPKAEAVATSAQRSTSAAAAKPSRPRLGNAATPHSPQPSNGAREAEIAAMVAALSRPATPPMAVPATAAGVAPEPVAAAPVANPAAASMLAEQSTQQAIPTRVERDSGYVFFRVGDPGQNARIGSLGVPLTAGRSLSVDPRRVPPGSPVFITAGLPDSQARLQRLAFAQDSPPESSRASVDLYWGTGESARRLAEATEGRVQMWLLLPRGSVPSS